jgi:hypothetical protein
MREIVALRTELGNASYKLGELKETKSKLRVCITRHKRITELLRRALPEEDQVGVGIDGMIESLLARMVRLAAEKE